MENTKQTITDLADSIINGKRISKADTDVFLNIETQSDIEHLQKESRRIFDHFHTTEAELCSIVNAKSGACSEDCAYCGQSVHYNCDAPSYGLMHSEYILREAMKMQEAGAKRFSLVTSGTGLKYEDLPAVCELVRTVKEKTDLKVDCSLGFLSKEQITELIKAGVSRFHHNLETSERHFPKVCTTHTFQDRYKMIQTIKELGAEVCSGGIFGLGERLEDRIDMALSLQELKVESVPINILDPRPGTPLEYEIPLKVNDLLLSIAVYRFILPEQLIRLAGGRERNLGAFQKQAIESGLNGAIIGGYLTTGGDPAEKDKELFTSAGFSI